MIKALLFASLVAFFFAVSEWWTEVLCDARKVRYERWLATRLRSGDWWARQNALVWQQRMYREWSVHGYCSYEGPWVSDD